MQTINPEVVAAAVGGDDLKGHAHQVADLGMGRKFGWINNQQDWADVYGLPKTNLFGVFGTTWYYKLDLPGVADFVAKYQAAYPDTQMKSPATCSTTATGRPVRCSKPSREAGRRTITP